MADEEDDDLYDEEFDFVDEDDEVADEEEEASADDSDLADGPDRERASDDVDEPDDAEEAVDEYGRPEPAPNYVVHVYESRKFKRTIDRPFTPEDAEAFATEFNRTSKNYNRIAVTGKNDAKPKKSLD